MFYLALLTGEPSSMLYWWEWVAYLFGFSSIIINALWLLMTFRERPTQNGERELIGSLQKSDESVNCQPVVKQRGKVTVYIGLPLLGILLMMMGYLIRDHQFVTNTRTYYGVTVVSQQNDHQYTVHIPDYPRDWPWIFCHPLKMPATVIDIRYEQRYGCKNVNGVGFVAPSKLKESRNAIQNGYDSATSTATTGRLAETF